MKVLVINGSPKAEKSNSLKLTNAFLKGFDGDNEIKIHHLVKMNIHSCKGCFSCWNKTPGECIIKDDMSSIIKDQLWADIIIWSFPLYYYNVPSILKSMIDRQLPICLPFMSDIETTGSGSHPPRYDMRGKRHILISTCGFYSAENNYDSVEKMFDNMLGKDQYEKIFCGQGELFRIPEVKARTEQYLDIVKLAGSEFAHGKISALTHKKLAELLYPRELFEKWADLSWGIEKETGESIDSTLVFTQQMAALYNKKSYDGKERVLEIFYTDLGKTYQIEMTSKGSRVIEGTTLQSTTRIETPWGVWKEIANGNIRGDIALAKGMYHVTGDFSLMIHWNEFFGSRINDDAVMKNNINKHKRPSMIPLLISWIVFWVAVSIHPLTGGIIAIICCALIPLVMFGRLTIYDCISTVCVSILSIAAIVTQTSVIPVVLGYGCFGLLWLISSFTKEPMCAAYVKYKYNGDDALKNPIFMKTNRIIAAGWGLLYVFIAAWTWFPLCFGYGIVMQIINNVITVLMGIFTVWFQHWYPCHIARG